MIKIYELSNGIKVVMESCDFFHSVSFGVWVKAGSRNETKENNGIAHMTEHMLLMVTQKNTAGEIARMHIPVRNVLLIIAKLCPRF